MAKYEKHEYWEERYTRDTEPFDWYQNWSGIKDVLGQYITPNQQILHVGCGNSRLSEEMLDDGYLNSINIDISQVVVKAMQEKYRDKTSIRYLQMDCRNMDFEEKTFDAAIDKGTLDAILYGESSANHAYKMVSEVHRVLSPNGVYVVISHAQPLLRYPYLDKPEFNWKITVHQVQKKTISSNADLAIDYKDKPNVLYIYVCKKKESLIKRP